MSNVKEAKWLQDALLFNNVGWGSNLNLTLIIGEHSGRKTPLDLGKLFALKEQEINMNMNEEEMIMSTHFPTSIFASFFLDAEKKAKDF